MTGATGWNGQMPVARGQQQARPAPGGGGGGDLADILERVLDKGIVIAGDIQINLLDIELLTIKLRLVVASVDRAKEMGIDWWERDPTLSSGYSELERENQQLRDRLERLEDGRAELPDAEPVDGELVEDVVEDDLPEDDLPEDGDLDEEDAQPEPPPRRRRARQ